MNQEKDRRRASGQLAEETAVRFLQMRGMTVLHRNWRCRRGEIDVVMRDGSTLVFVEVRSRSLRGRRFGGAVEAVDRRKQQKLALLARIYIQREHPSFSALRFDVVAMDEAEEGEPRITYLQNAFYL